MRRHARTRRDPRLNRQTDRHTHREREREGYIFFFLSLSLSLSRELSRERERKKTTRAHCIFPFTLSVLGVAVLVKNEDERVLLLQTLAGDV